MKKSTIACITLPLVLLSTIACNRGKAADTENSIDKTETVKTDSIQEKTVLTIDTLDFNKRMVAMSNNDTTGRSVGNPYKGYTAQTERCRFVGGCRSKSHHPGDRRITQGGRDRRI